MIAVVGAGAFGTALAVTLAKDGRNVSLVARDTQTVSTMSATRENTARLPGVLLPENLTISSSIDSAPIVLLAIPTQKLPNVLQSQKASLSGKTLVACCKGIDVLTGRGPTDTIAQYVGDAVPTILSGPSFAADIGSGKPTALTLAGRGDLNGLQQQLSTKTLRLYTSDDPKGVEIGGALKNVVAIACGAAIGAGLGESARAALMTRGYAEMVRFAATRGAKTTTLSGLSGFGDLALTASSEKSRNYRYGLALGQAAEIPVETTEGLATAKAVAALARNEQIDMPLTCAVADVLAGQVSLETAIAYILNRPLRAE